MADKNKLEEYINNMEIPKPEDVLPKECISNSINVIDFKAIRRRRLRIIGEIGLAACCMAFVATLVIPSWHKDINKDKNNDDSAGISQSTKVASTDDSTNTAKEYDDGVIGENKNYGSDGASSDIVSEFAAKDASADYATDGDMAYTDDSTEDDYILGDSDYSGETNGEEYEAGTLTGGEIRDLKNWDNWTHVIDKDYMSSWNIVPTQMISVYVHNGNTAINNAKVKLVSDGKTIYEAVTDVKGYAYLIYNYANEDSFTPDTIEVENKSGEFDSYSVKDNINSKNELEVESDLSNEAVNLDLMFVVDTTGSMGDELDYLKAELEDVINNVQDATGASIRTSVNFYRDEGDEYVVKYYDFRDDPSQVTKLLNEQSADGGGDWEEAVHTALDNAINSHSWSEDSTVKLMFLVLDAPAHNTDEIKAQLAKLVKKASKEGIRIIPVAASGADDDTQQLLRTFAIMTGGTFIFLDDNSGVGLAHDVTVDSSEYDSEHLNDMLIRIIGEYCGVDIDTQKVVTPTQKPDENPNNK